MDFKRPLGATRTPFRNPPRVRGPASQADAEAQEQLERLKGEFPSETRWQAFYRSVLVALILGGLLLGIAFYAYMTLTARSRFEEDCRARAAEVV